MGSLVLVVLLAQQQVTHRTYDVNGRAVVDVRDLNGRQVPLETVEERAVSDGVMERTIRRRDPNGNPLPVERVRIETRTLGDGSTEVVTTVQRADMNGNLALAERRTAMTRKSGDNSDTVETVERPGISGGFEIAERRETAQRTSGETTVVQRPDANGRLTETGRVVVAREGKTENRVEYEATGGEMKLVRQTVTRTDRDRTETDVFTPGLNGQPRLSHRQVVEKTRTAGGVTSTLSVQLADGSGRLGAPRVAEETTYTGECKPAP